jgi:hypothetical protein
MKSTSLKDKMMGKMSRWFKITCQDTTPLISEAMDHSLPFTKRLRLKLHLSICQVCRFYQKQLQTICRLARKLGEEDSPVYQNLKMTDECKDRMKETLKNSQQRSS